MKLKEFTLFLKKVAAELQIGNERPLRNELVIDEI